MKQDKDSKRFIPNFLKLARKTEGWLCCGEALKEAVDALQEPPWWQRPQKGTPRGWFWPNVPLFLIGLSLENVLKGLIVHSHPEYVTDTGKLDRRLQGHHLLHLTEEARLLGECSEVEIDLLKRAGQAVVYWGRYPIPKKAVQLEGATWHAADYETYGGLYCRRAALLIRTFPVPDYPCGFHPNGQRRFLTHDQYVQWRLYGKAPDFLPPCDPGSGPPTG